MDGQLRIVYLISLHFSGSKFKCCLCKPCFTFIHILLTNKFVSSQNLSVPSQLLQYSHNFKLLLPCIRKLEVWEIIMLPACTTQPDFSLSEFSYYYKHPRIWKTKYGTEWCVPSHSMWQKLSLCLDQSIWGLLLGAK